MIWTRRSGNTLILPRLSLCLKPIRSIFARPDKLTDPHEGDFTRPGRHMRADIKVPGKKDPEDAYEIHTLAKLCKSAMNRQFGLSNNFLGGFNQSNLFEYCRLGRGTPIRNRAFPSALLRGSFIQPMPDCSYWKKGSPLYEQRIRDMVTSHTFFNWS
jgi:hypothetical protein